MKHLIILFFAVFLTACDLIPTMPGGKQETPTATTSNADAALLAGFEALHNGSYQRAEGKFNAALDSLPQYDAGQVQARIGKILIYLTPDSGFYDVERAQNTYNEINILTKRVEMTNTVYEQTLVLSVKQLVAAEVANRDNKRKLANASGSSKNLENEVARLKAEKAQADQTIAKLRSLTLQR